MDLRYLCSYITHQNQNHKRLSLPLVTLDWIIISNIHLWELSMHHQLDTDIYKSEYKDTN